MLRRVLHVVFNNIIIPNAPSVACTEKAEAVHEVKLYELKYDEQGRDIARCREKVMI